MADSKPTDKPAKAAPKAAPKAKKTSTVPHSHYVMDLYFAADDGSSKLRREALRIVADDDAAAIAEAQRIDQWKKTASFQVRSIRNSARSGDKVIYSSAPADDETDAPTDQPGASA